MPQINVTYANALGGQAATKVPVQQGTTLEQLLETQGGVPDKAKFTIDRKQVELDHVLKDGDYIAVTPEQIKGA